VIVTGLEAVSRRRRQAVRHCHRLHYFALASLLAAVTATASAQSQAGAPASLSEEIEPRRIGIAGTTMIGVSGHLDSVFSSERDAPFNLTLHADAGRFLTRRLAVRGGITGTASLGGDDADDRPRGIGEPALHAFGGALFYFSPQSMASLYAGADYWAQLTQRGTADRGALVGTVGAQGAVSSRASLFLEGGYGVGLTKGEEGETLTRLIARVGIRLKF